jgi:hypothetical protein
MSIEAMKQALEALCNLLEQYYTNNVAGTDCDQAHAAITTLRTAIEQAEKQEPECPDGYKLVMVEIDAPRNEPDWDECIRQAELSTGIKVERNTLSIIIREVRRWLLSTPPAAPVQEPVDRNIITRFLADKGVYLAKESVDELMKRLAPAAQRQWTGLTQSETFNMPLAHHWLTSKTLRDAYKLGALDAEAKLREKNGGQA